MIDECWKTIENAANYEVSNMGRIKNTKSGQVLNPGLVGSGYKQVSLRMKDETLKKFYVHRLVAQYWLPTPEDGEIEVNHKNLDKTDNRVDNLEWITPSENQKHRHRMGNIKTSNRRVGQYNEDGYLIREFNSVIEAARFLGKQRQQIDRALHGRSNTAYGYHWKFLD